MRIALLTDGVWPFTIGGMQKHSYYLCKYLIRQGVQVDVYYTVQDSNKIIDCKAVFDEVDVTNLQFIYVSYPESIYFPGHYLWEKYKYSRRIANILFDRKSDYDLIYAQGLAGWYFIQNMPRNSQIPPVVLNFHGLNMFQKVSSIRNRLEQLMFKPIAKKLLLKTDYAQSLGKRLTALLVKEGVAENRIAEIGIGIEKSWIVDTISECSGSARVFVFVGRWDRIKGIVELTDVLRLLLEKYDFYFHFVGPFPEQRRLVSSKIQYHGELKTETELKKVLDASDFLVLPSYSEGMPTVILEAMARGCAIIATDVGAVSDLVSNENGMLIEPLSTETLYNAMVTAINIRDEVLFEMKQASLRKINRDFLWDSLIFKMLSFFKTTFSKTAKISVL